MTVSEAITIATHNARHFKTTIAFALCLQVNKPKPRDCHDVHWQAVLVDVIFHVHCVCGIQHSLCNVS